MEQPLVSVRLQTYNHAAFIKDAIESILMQQTTFPFEVVIGDDFSSDGTTEICMEYASKYPNRIKLLQRARGDAYDLERQKKGRLYNFANTVANCTGKYVALLDGDDLWGDPEKLQIQVAFLEANPDFVLCHYDAKIIDEHNQVTKASKLLNENKRDFQESELQKGAFLLSSTICFRNVIHDFPAEFTQVHNGEKFLISLLGQYGKGKYMGSDLQPDSYRIHSSGIWSSVNEIHRLERSYETYSLLCQFHSRSGREEIAAHFHDSAEKYLTWLQIEAFKQGNRAMLKKMMSLNLKQFRTSNDLIHLKNALKAGLYTINPLLKPIS